MEERRWHGANGQSPESNLVQENQNCLHVESAIPSETLWHPKVKGLEKKKSVAEEQNTFWVLLKSHS